MKTTARKNGYRGEARQDPALRPMVLRRRLCLARCADGLRCVLPIGHDEGKCRSH